MQMGKAKWSVQAPGKIRSEWGIKSLRPSQLYVPYGVILHIRISAGGGQQYIPPAILFDALHRQTWAAIGTIESERGEQR